MRRLLKSFSPDPHDQFSINRSTTHSCAQDTYYSKGSGGGMKVTYCTQVNIRPRFIFAHNDRIQNWTNIVLFTILRM